MWHIGDIISLESYTPRLNILFYVASDAQSHLFVYEPFIAIQLS